MKPANPQNPEYDRGYADGYRDRGIQQLASDLRELKNLTQEDISWLEAFSKPLPQKIKACFGMS